MPEVVSEVHPRLVYSWAECNESYQLKRDTMVMWDISSQKAAASILDAVMQRQLQLSI